MAMQLANIVRKIGVLAYYEWYSDQCQMFVLTLKMKSFVVYMSKIIKRFWHPVSMIFYPMSSKIFSPDLTEAFFVLIRHSKTRQKDSNPRGLIPFAFSVYDQLIIKNNTLKKLFLLLNLYCRCTSKMIPTFCLSYIFPLNGLLWTEVDACQTKLAMVLPNWYRINQRNIFYRANSVTDSASIAVAIDFKVLVVSF